MTAQNKLYKNWLTVGLVAAALTLSACGKKEEAAVEAAPAADAQTSVEQEAVASANDDIAVASADGSDTDTVVMSDDEIMSGDVAIATADEAEVIDGSESEEHVSTY